MRVAGIANSPAGLSGIFDQHDFPRDHLMTDALRLAWKPVTIGFLLLVAADALLFRTGVYFRYLEPESTAGTTTNNLSLFDHDYRNDAKNVLVIGDSRVGEGFSPSAANKVGRIHGVNFVRIGMPSSTPRVWNYFLKRVDRESQPLAAVVLMTTSLRDGDYIENMNDRVLDISYTMPLLRLADIPEFVWSFHGHDARMRALLAVALPGLAMQTDLHAFLASPVTRVEKARLWKRYYPEWMNGYLGRTERIPDVAPSALSAPSFDPSLVPPDVAKPLSEYLRNMRAPRPPHLTEEMKEYRSLWYGRIAERYRSRNVPVFVYQMPRGPFHKELVGDQPAEGALLELEGAHKLVLVDSVPFVDLEQPQYFFDFLHLNAVGRLAFSQRLAEIVTPLVP
jgi:hypothetical protein